MRRSRPFTGEGTNESHSSADVFFKLTSCHLTCYVEFVCEAFVDFHLFFQCMLSKLQPHFASSLQAVGLENVAFFDLVCYTGVNTGVDR